MGSDRCLNAISGGVKKWVMVFHYEWGTFQWGTFLGAYGGTGSESSFCLRPKRVAMRAVKKIM
jgi:hypothetical protein